MNAPARTRQTTRLSADDVRALAWEHLHGISDATTRVLWRDAGSMAGILRLAPGAQLEEHVHGHGHHHVYVLAGQCGVDGDTLPAGSYVHVPAGKPHALRAEGPDECVMFYLFLEDVRPTADR